MNVIHKNLADGRWFTLTLAEQLGNVGSEFSRAIIWKLREKEKFQNAQARFFELMDLTLTDQRWKGPRRRELARVREQSAEALESGSANLQRYFDQFASLARAKR